MSDYLPSSDTDLRVWATNLIAYANSNLAALGLVAADITPVTTAQTSFNTSVDGWTTSSAAAAAARETKDVNRDGFEAKLRALVKRLQANPAVTSAQKQAMGITVATTDRTPVSVPVSRPVVEIDSAQKLQHRIWFSDELTGRFARPEGVTGAQIWMKLGGEPTENVAEMQYVATATRNNHLVAYSLADRGKRAYYMLRWINTRGQTGPWSRLVFATVDG